MSDEKRNGEPNKINGIPVPAATRKNGKPYFVKSGPRFGREKPAIAGPGRPRIPDEVKQRRKDALQILKDAAPEMAARIAELANDKDPDIAIKACKVGLDKVVPNLEEVDLNDRSAYDGEPVAHILAAERLITRAIEATIGAGPNGDSQGQG